MQIRLLWLLFRAFSASRMTSQIAVHARHTPQNRRFFSLLRYEATRRGVSTRTETDRARRAEQKTKRRSAKR